MAIYIKGLYEITKKRNPFGLTKYLVFVGSFVWGDVFVVAPFWVIVSIVSLLLNSWYLFLLFVSLFWVIRSLGEMIYWLNEQFAGKFRNPPHTLNFYRIFKNDSIWFIYQVIWECVFVFSLVLSLYFSKMWLESM